MPELPRFRVTDRKTEAIFEILGLTYDDFRPEDTVFVAGSGLRQKFERDIAPRVSEVFACDPSLAVGSGWRVWFNNSDPDGLNAVTYVETDDREDLITAEEFALLRKVDMPNNLHIITDKIPPIKMPDDSVDKGFDVIGASNYMPVEDLEEYYREIFRVLRPGGEFRLGPLNRMEYWERIFSTVALPPDIKKEPLNVWGKPLGVIISKLRVES